MATYKSEEVGLKASAEKVFSRLSDFQSLKTLLEQVPQDKIKASDKEMMDNLHITEDSIELPGGPVGSIKLRVVERTAPSRITLRGEGTPVPLQLQLDIHPVDEYSSRAQAKVDIEVPAMLRPMISGPMQKMTEQFALVLRSLPFT